jgi:hypothetical protein
MGGTWGTTAAYTVNGRNLCHDCAVKQLGFGALGGRDEAEGMAPFLIRINPGDD